VTWVVPLALGGFAILLMVGFTMLSARKRHRALAAPAAVVGPRILVHDINDDRCTGCDACVAVCPTNVLDLVANKSRVLRFEDCIQCEACMFACPTEALVMFPEGGTPPSLKVPEIDEFFQTAVPGQYLIGEVAGKPLVKNAANLGRAVIEHMLTTGMRAGALGAGEGIVDVAIVGSGPGGLSAALTCIQRGLSYVVLEKEQMIASTIARYPKGKLVMCEPYDAANLSFLPVFDAGKEQLIPIWRELIDRVGLTIKQGESVESVGLGGDGAFEVRSTVSTYRAQRVVLSIGTRGKPRTLQVAGENLPKVFSLLEDPDEWRGRAVLVVGGGDSACEAAVALSDAGAKVMISYRGKGFGRAAPKNKQAIEGYAAEGRIKAKLGSQVLGFEPDSVTLALGDGSQKRYPNDAVFVLIGADPPVQWLEKMGIRFVERAHQYQLGKTDDIVRKLVARAIECPEDAARAAAQVLGGSIGVGPPRPATPAPGANGESGPRKWLRSATSIFSNRGMSGVMPMPMPPAPAAAPPAARPDARVQRAKKFDAPVPLSEFAKRGKSSSHTHTGHGRRDQLSAGERTRILRMLRDEGGRLADEDSQVYIGAAPASRDYDFELDDGPVSAPPVLRPDVPAKPAVVVGIAQAQAARTNNRRSAERAAAAVSAHPRPGQPPAPPVPPPAAPPPPPPRTRNSSAVAPAPRRSVPASFGEEPTRQVDDELLTALRNAAPAKPSPRLPPPNGNRPVQSARHDEPTRLASLATMQYDDTQGLDPGLDPGLDEMTRPSDDLRPRFPTTAPATDPSHDLFEDHHDPDEATRMASLDAMAAMERARNHSSSNEERTRAVNIRNDPSISDIDWDLD
jgi:thioredoxin reductase (NADPH)